MASTIVEFDYAPGVSPTLKLFLDKNDTIQNGAGDAGTEETNRGGTYLATVTEALSGWHKAYVTDGSFTQPIGWVYLQDDTNTYRVDRTGLPSTGSMTAQVDEMKGGTFNSSTDTLEAIRDRGDAAWLTATGFSTHSAADVRSEVDANSTQLSTIVTHLTDIKGGTFNDTTDSLEAIRDRGDAAWLTATGFSTHTAADVRSEIDVNSTQLTTIVTHLTDIKGATFNNATDSLEAIRDRGDAAWIAATGFSTHSAADVRAEVDTNSTQLSTIVSSIAALNNISAADVWTGAGTIIDGKTPEQALEIIAAVVAGQVSGADTIEEIFLGLDGLTTRVTVTADASGNRTTVVYA